MRKHTYRNPVGVSRFTGLLLISPFIIGMAVFMIYPFICSFILGLTDYDGIHPPEFTGLDNYRHMLKDRSFRNAFKVTVKYALLLVPMKLIVSLLTALLLNIEIKGIG
ncbi:MAG: sugar ABC transporter permease, partial [Ruminococcus sp.]|nr:sugar ABC transporter permease [Ruminococcus sp.]